VVDGCQDHSNDPGALQMDWLEVQLMEYRERGMQVWLTGHVPPHMGHYFDNCCKLSLSRRPSSSRPDLRYGDLALRYQDTIVGHLYGHM
jgi:endopolyphosphatase